ncbi:purine NTPase, putative (plasmid) [Legionella adelaidensis]|uniref:Purine NTPase n=1 Tax=Legionella adelaidensis TaxID=45056 RepID=A0A0W0R4Z2_9GAMM|nr:hypothetical protein [Legionella adelaidensis]KTC66101.1 purine NTPase [Legionella adelaidensis]VEH85829.1 purine NTPase, putative [Legionella adelaidensis]
MRISRETLQFNFNQWRGDYQAHNENPFILTALLIHDFLQGIHLKAIQLKLSDHNSEAFKSFDLYDKRAIGSLLLGKLHIDEYQKKVNHSSKEFSLLTDIKSILAELYLDHGSLPKQSHLEALITNYLRWLNQAIPNSEVYDLVLSLYTMLRITFINLNNVNFAMRIFIRTQGFKVNDIKDAIQNAMTKTEEFLSVIENSKSTWETPKNQDSSPTPMSLSAHFRDQSLRVINRQDPLPENIERVSIFLKNTQVNLAALLKLRKQREILSGQFEHAKTLEFAVLSNERLLTGRKYALELIQENRESFKCLLKNAKQKERAQWQIWLMELQFPSPIRKVANSFQYALSWIGSLPASVFRILVPHHIQERIKEFVPSTFDSECKQQLIALAKKQSHNLISRIKEIDHKIECQIQRLANGSQGAKLLLYKANPQKLIELFHTNAATIEAIEHFECLSKKILHNEAILKKIRGLYIYVNALIEEHSSLLVSLLNLLEHYLGGFFKTQKSEKVKESKLILNELYELEREYTTKLNTDIRVIKEDPAIEDNIKGIFSNLLTNPEIKPEPRIRPSVKNMHSAFQYIQTRYQVIKEKCWEERPENKDFFAKPL